MTQWFDEDQLPARPGVYERLPKVIEGTRFAYWTGKQWNVWADTPEEANSIRHFSMKAQVVNRQWRGLAVKP